MQNVRKKAITLERQQRLSVSRLWRLQRNFFDSKGIEAWRAGYVPHHITSNPFIADAYAKVVFGFLRDCRDSDAVPLDLRQPVYIVELGSGPGRFAYLFLKKFLALQRNSVLKNIPIRYVMTDLAERNLEHARAHPWLQSFVDEGSLDFARFDIEQDQQLKLMHSRETICAKDLVNPLIVIANYVFDGVPQDAFFVSEGRLFETLVTLTTPRKEKDPDDPEILSRLELSYDYNQVNRNYYRDASWNRILLDYKQRLSQTAFLFPTAALQCVRNLQEVANGRMLLLSGDRGYSEDQSLKQGNGKPALSLHGSFSMMVDYQIIGEYCRQLGAQVLHPPPPTRHLNISAFMFGDSPGDFVETRSAYADAIEKFGPDSFFTLKEVVAQIYDVLSLDEMLAFLRLSGWDYRRLWECLPVLKKHLADLSDFQKQQLHEAIVKVWDSYLPIGEEIDLAFELGTFLLEMEFHEEALEFLQRSIELYGRAPGTAYNIAVCYYGLGQTDRALDYLHDALSLDPEFAEARDLCAELESKLSKSFASRVQESSLDGVSTVRGSGWVADRHP